MLDVRLKKKLGDCLVNIAFDAPAIGVTALFGPSGVGKTSVINMVAGLLRPDSGHIIVNKETLFHSEKKINLLPEKRKTGYIFQDGRLFPHLKVRSNLMYGMKGSLKNPPALFTEVVDLLGIHSLLDRRPSRLSGGEKQRVAIGRALLSNPELLLMDEPFASLDKSRTEEILPFVSLMCKKFSIPVLYVSHSYEEIQKIADTLVVMENGFGKQKKLWRD